MNRLLQLSATIAALSLLFCQSPESDSGKAVLNVEGDSAYLDFSRLRITLVDSNGRDTALLFNDSLKSLDDLKRLRVELSPVGKVALVIQGFASGDNAHLLYEEVRIFDAANNTLLSTRKRRLDAILKSLVPSSGSLVPGFSDTLYAYTVVVGNAVTGITFRTAADPAAKVLVAGKTVAAEAWCDTIPLVEGDNAIAIRVVAGNGDTGVYATQVHRRSANAALKALRVSRGILSPDFNPGVSAFSDTVSASSLALTAIAQNGNVQSITIGSTRTASDSVVVTVPLNLGKNDISVEVKAEEGNSKVYTLNVVRKLFLSTFGGEGRSQGNSVQQTGDGGFIVAGFALPSGASQRVAYLLRTDGQGKALSGWPKTFRETESIQGYSVQQTSDGGFIVAGSMNSSGASQMDVYLLRTDGQGNPLSGWPKIFGRTGDEEGYSVQQTSDGGFIVAGFAASSGDGQKDVYLLRTDGQGNPLPGWPKTFGKDGNDYGYSVRQTSDSGFIVAGWTNSYGAGEDDLYLLRTDGQGQALAGWPKTFGRIGRDQGSSVQQTSDGGFIVTGYTTSPETGRKDAYLLRTDGQGNPLSGWPKVFGGSGDEVGISAQQAKDGGFIVAGYTSSSGAGRDNVYLMRTDGQGNALPGWPKTFGETGYIGRAYSIQNTGDGGFIITGVYTTESAEIPKKNESFLLKLDADGNPE